MGDRRFVSPFERVRRAQDRAFAIALLADEEVVAALAAASEASDALLANVLATEAQNRMARLGAIVRHAGDGLLSVDAQGAITAVNPAAERLLGWREAELRARDAHETLHREDEDGRPVPRDECPLQRCLRERRIVRVTIPLLRKDGGHVVVHATLSPIVRDGDVTGAVATLREVGTQTPAPCAEPPAVPAPLPGQVPATVRAPLVWA